MIELKLSQNIQNIQVQNVRQKSNSSLVTKKKPGGDNVRPPPADGLHPVPQLVEAVGVLPSEEPLKVLEEELILHQKVDVGIVEATETNRC